MNECLTRKEFITTLKRELQNIDPTELEEVVRYYNEYFDDAQELGDDNLQKALLELGSPDKIVHDIRQNLTVKNLCDDEKNENFKNIVLVTLGVFLLPIVFSLIMTFSLAVIFVAILCFNLVFLAYFLFLKFRRFKNK